MRMTFLLLVVSGWLVGCSSAPVETSTTSEGQTSSAPKEAAPPREATRASRPEANTRAGGSENERELAEAIRAQSDSRILAAAQKILWQNPDDDRALNSAAMVYHRQGRNDLAAYLIDRAIGKHPKKSELHGNLGLIELARGRRAEAIQSFRRAVEMNPDDSVSAANLGAIYLEVRDYPKAAVVLEIAARRGLRDARVLNNYGVALAASGKYDDALKAYDQALRENANSRETMLNKAILLVEHLDRPKDAMEVINRLKFLGVPPESRERLSSLENKASAGVR